MNKNSIKSAFIAFLCISTYTLTMENYHNNGCNFYAQPGETFLPYDYNSNNTTSYLNYVPTTQNTESSSTKDASNQTVIILVNSSNSDENPYSHALPYECYDTTPVTSANTPMDDRYNITECYNNSYGNAFYQTFYPSTAPPATHIKSVNPKEIKTNKRKYVGEDNGPKKKKYKTGINSTNGHHGQTTNEQDDSDSDILNSKNQRSKNSKERSKSSKEYRAKINYQYSLLQKLVNIPLNSTRAQALQAAMQEIQTLRAANDALKNETQNNICQNCYNQIIQDNTPLIHKAPSKVETLMPVLQKTKKIEQNKPNNHRLS